MGGCWGVAAKAAATPAGFGPRWDMENFGIHSLQLRRVCVGGLVRVYGTYFPRGPLMSAKH